MRLKTLTGHSSIINFTHIKKFVKKMTEMSLKDRMAHQETHDESKSQRRVIL